MTVKAEQSDVLGQPAVCLNAGELEAVVLPASGANLIRLRHAPSGCDILRTPDTWAAYMEHPALFGLPVLFPPNRIADGVFAYAGVTYHFPITEPARHNHLHGFLHTRPWRVEAVTAAENEGRASAVFSFASVEHPDVTAVFPHDFIVSLAYELEGGRLAQMVEIENRGDRPMPWGLGFHTTFAAPFQPGGEALVAVDLDERWELDDRLLPTGRREALADPDAWRTGQNLYGVALDDVFTARHDPVSGETRAVVRDTGAGIEVVYSCDEGYRHWVVYTADGRRGFVCLEPYSWVTNAPNLALPAEETGFAVLAPGASVRRRTSLAVRRI